MSNALPLLIVQTGRTHAHIRERLGDFDDWVAAGLREGGAEVLTHDAQSDEPPPPMQSIGGIVLTGSHAMVSDREPWSEALVPWLQQAVAQSVPTLGICYGHQLLAHALGGEVAHHPQGIEIGTVQVQRHAQAHDDALLGHLPPSFKAQAVHWQTVRRLPPEAVVLASNAHEPHHAFRMGANAWGVQFHPEFSDAALHTYLDSLAATLRSANLDVEHIKNAVRSTPDAASLLPVFARLALRQAAGA
jgi:GMP synthase (glutamine-hydrolysing)